MKTSEMRQPKALVVLFFTEMWERFSFYGMRALLVLYLIQKLFTDLSEPTAKAVAIGIFAAYGSLVYASPFIGGLIADKFLGHRKAIIWGAILMAAGHFIMAIENEFFLYVALSFIIIGSGFFKPNMPTILGSLYKEKDPRRDSGFTIYYMSVNLGAFISPLICGLVGETYGWHYGFAIAGIGMLAGLFIFLKFGYMLDYHEETDPNTNETIIVHKPVGEVPDKEKLAKKWLGFSCEMWIYSICVLCVFGVSLLVKHYEIMTYVLFPFTAAILGILFVIALRSEKVERDRLFVILILLMFTTLFWSFFEQAGSSLTLYAKENVDRNILGSIVPASLFQSVNPMFILILASPFSVLWMQLAQRKKEPSTPIKFSIGILLLSIGFLILGVAPSFLSFETITEENAVLRIAAVPAIFLAVSYLLQTMGELCLSPIGLSMVSRLAPAKIAGMVIGAWHLSSSLAFQIGGWIATASTTTESTQEITTEQSTGKPDKVSKDTYVTQSSDFDEESVSRAVSKKYISESEAQQLSAEEKSSLSHLLQYTNVFVRVGIVALLASILLFFLSPFITRMMHED